MSGKFSCYYQMKDRRYRIRIQIRYSLLSFGVCKLLPGAVSVKDKIFIHRLAVIDRDIDQISFISMDSWSRTTTRMRGTLQGGVG